MRKKIMMGMLIVLLGGSLFGCGQGENPDTTDLQGTLTPEATNAPEVTQAVFQPVKKEEETKLTGLQEQLEKVEGVEAEKWNALNRSDGNSLFCVDGETGVVYYVNYNKDFYIYRIKDREVKLAVELPAKELYCQNGSVYFMIDTYGKYQIKGISDGDIYRYTPETGVIELVYAAGAVEGSSYHDMRVTEEGIHFNYTQSAVKREDGLEARETICLFLAFEAEKPVKEDYLENINGWGEYAICPVFTTESPNKPTLSLILRKDFKQKKDLGLESNPCAYCVVGDTLYYLPGSNNTKVYAKDLNTGETTEYDFGDAIKTQLVFSHNEKMTDEEFDAYVNRYRLLTNFIIVGDFLYVSSGLDLYQMNMLTGEVHAYQSSDSSGGVFGTLYTDGTDLYVMYSTNSQSPIYLAKVYVDRVGEDNVGMITVEVEAVKETK